MDLNALLEDQNPWWREPAARAARAWPVRREVQARVLEQVMRTGDRRAVVLLGPRQVGKTTLLLQMVDDLLDRGWPPTNLLYFNFDDDRITAEVTARDVVRIQPAGMDAGRPRVLLLDEVRRVANWDRWLKQAVDRGTGERIVVTDSAASLLRESGRESGVGRWDEVILEGLTFAEFARVHGADAGDENRTGTSRIAELQEPYLALGGFPEHALSRDFARVRSRLRTQVVERAIQRDLASEVEAPDRLRALFVYLVQQSGSESNARARAADLGGVDPRSVARWVELLERTLLLQALPRFTPHAAARLRSRSKLYAADHGLVQAFAESPVDDREVRGRVFEAVVFRHLRELARARGGELRFLREGEKVEIDFLLSVAGTTWAVEVTQSLRLKQDKVEALASASRQVGAHAALIYGGATRGQVGEISVVPLVEFLVDPLAALVGEVER